MLIDGKEMTFEAALILLWSSDHKDAVKIHVALVAYVSDLESRIPKMHGGLPCPACDSALVMKDGSPLTRERLLGLGIPDEVLREAGL